MPFGLRTRMGPGNHVLDGVQIPHWKGQFWGGNGRPIVKYRVFLQWAVQKWLNRSICRLGCGFGWAKGSTSSIIFARRHQCAHMGGHIGATWRIHLNRPSAAAMRSYVKLLWPLVISSLHTFPAASRPMYAVGYRNTAVVKPTCLWRAIAALRKSTISLMVIFSMSIVAWFRLQRFMWSDSEQHWRTSLQRYIGRMEPP